MMTQWKTGRLYSHQDFDDCCHHAIEFAVSTGEIQCR